DEGVGLAEALDRRWDLIVANFGVGLLHLAKGEVEAAYAVLERCLALCSVEEYPRWFAVIGAHLGHAYTLEGRIAQAVPLLEQAAAFTRSGHHARLTAYLSEAYLRAGRRDEAMALAAQTLDLARKRNERGNEAWVLRLLGEIEADPDPPKAPAAERHYREALAVAEELGMRPLRAHCHLGLGRLARRTGSRRDADGHLTAATRLFREMGLSRWVARAEAALEGEVG
ncbi:MAG TPA: tetratricopeptide repeat protein, partial [Solirubrobacterales bacterium]|nr:tetratricopeptide repeat protein [Solirubrobacterales bacterium]